MRKFLASLLLLATLLPFTAKADDLTIYNGTTTNQYVPAWIGRFDSYTRTQHVIPANKLADMNGALITSIKYYSNLTAAYTTDCAVDVYLMEVDYTSISAFVAKEDATIVYQGILDFASNGECVITLTTPYMYGGGNLLIGMENPTKGTYKSVKFKGQNVNGAAVSGYNANSLNDITPTVRGFLPKTTFTYENVSTGTTIVTNPAVINLGDRPNNGWMPPYMFELVNNGLPGTVKNMEANAPFVAYTENLPAEIGFEGTVPVGLSTMTTDATGSVTDQFLVSYEGSRDFVTFDATVNFYTAATPDIWELAQNVTTFPYNATISGNANIHKNYNLPGAAENAKDAVYKITLDNDAMISATTTGANGVSAIYPEDFNGVGGPDVDNYYEYESPEVADGPIATWFHYDYTGTTVFTGGSGGLYFGYRIPASLIQELGYGACSIYAVETAAYEAAPYYLLLCRGGEAPEEIVAFEVAEPDALSYFDITLEEPFLLGDEEDLWVLFYSDGNNPAYCGKNPVDANGALWYSADGDTWNTAANYTPLIYCQLLELSTGRQVTMNLADFSFKANGNADFTEMAANVQGVSRAQGYLEGNTQRGNRDAMVQDLYVTAGTYYVAIASTDNNFPVSITKAAASTPEPAVVVSPVDGATDVSAPVLLEWVIGNYTKEMQVLLGTQYPPTDVFMDWTDQLVSGALVMELEHNKTYFVQVNTRNDSGVTEGIVSGFTTNIDPVTGFAVMNDKLYPGDAAQFSWEANRAFMGYNLYKDGVKVNEEPITETEYAVEGLTYNMTGYNFQVTALYAEGESTPSAPVKVYMTGNGIVSGTIYEQDSITPLPNATVEFRGIDAYEQTQTIVATADENGDYEAQVYEGVYEVFAYANGYAECQYDGEITVVYEEAISGIDIYVHEFYAPLGMITAELVENKVEVEWAWGLAESIVDFETGDFSQAEFNNESSDYPWAITTNNPYEGTYCMKSTCENQNYGVSYIEATVEVPFDAKMGFYVKVSSENTYDKFHFYIDGVEKGTALSGEVAYTYKEYSVEAGTHTYKWEYAKDVSMSSGDDCVYIDNILLYREDIPAPPIPGATVYDFENETMMDWTSLDADGDGYGWVSSGNPGIYHNSGVVLAGTGHNDSQGYVISGSYSNSAGIALNPDNYLIAPTQISAVNGAQISFFACAQDASYAAEHFGVAVSTTTATASAFTTIQEWTMTAKDKGRATTATRAGDRQGSWYEYTVDLSAYAGQNIWVALRHFNCYDMFILNVDDITLADGSAKGMADRSFQHFNLYRRNNFTEEMELIATPNDTTFNYTDTQWNNLPAGEYQWGIQAYYEGNAAPADRDDSDVTYSFEGSMDGWTTIDADNDGYNWQLASILMAGYLIPSHDGEDCITSQSYASGVGPLTPDNYLVSPQGQYSQISFWACAQDASYAGEHYGVAVSTTGTNANDFTTIAEWTMTAKSTGNATGNYMRRDRGNREGTWYQKTVDLSAYAGQDIYVAIRHFNCTDMFYLNVDEVVLSGESGGTPTPPDPPTPPTPSDGPGMSDILWSNPIDKDMIATVTINVSLNSGQAPTGATVEMVGDQTFSAVVDATGVVVFENVRKGEYALTVAMDEFVSAYNETPVTIAQNETTINVMLYEIIGNIDGLYVSTTGFAKWDGLVPGGDIPTPPTPPTPPTGGQWYSYDNGGDYATGIGLGGGSFSWAVMFPAGSYQGNMVTKVAAYDASYPMTGTVTIYNDGSNAPASAVGTMDITFTGAGDFVEFEFPQPVAVDPSKNVWVVFYNASGATYPAAATTGSDLNGQWVSIDGVEWMDLGTAGVPGYVWLIRAYIASGKGEVTEISVPQRPHDGGKLAKVDAPIVNKGNRAPLVYKLMLDGVYAGETAYPGYQFNVEGLEEGSEHVASVLPVYATGEGEWAEFTWTYSSCENYAGLTEEPTAAWQGQDVVLNWVLPEGGDTPPTPPTPPTGGQWYSYDNGGDYATGIGLGGGSFSWAVMFPAGSYEGNMVTKVSAYEAVGYPMTGTVTIYNDGASAPANAVGEMNVTFTGVDDFVEYEFPSPVTIDPSKNLWVVFYNASGATYPAAACVGSDLNGQWVSIDGVEWMDLGTAGVPGYVWMIRAYVASGAKGEVTEISVPQRPHDGGQLAAVKANRSREDVMYSFEGTMDGWTTIDADGDGQNWILGSILMAGYSIPSHDGDDCICSASYTSSTGALTPDNYLVSPTKAQYSEISLWACAQDPSYAAEHFGVAVSTTGNTNAADFTTVAEWTMTSKSTGASGNYMSRSREGKEGTWYLKTVDLSAYAGQEIWVAIRHFGCTDMFYLDLDEVTLTMGDGPLPPVPPTPGESAVLGAAIFRNGDCIAEVMAPEMTYTDVNPGEAAEYEIRVIYDGEKFAADTLGGGYIGTYYAMSCPLSCYPGDLTCDAPENLAGEYVWDNGTFGAQISWTYGEAPSSDIDIDFEDASMGNWTTIDADNDGYNWMVGTAFGGHNGSTGIVYSQSYDNSVGALTPDNYFVSPQTPLGGSFSFWACAQDNAWAAEHFGVAVSTAGNTSAADFTTVQEWTMTAKSNGRPNSVRGEREQGTWYQYTVDLSSYAGQMGYIAIRHFNCTDWFYIDVDDITYTLGKRAGDPVNFAVYRNGSQIATVPYNGAYSYTYFDNVAAGNYEYQVKALYEDCESDFALTSAGQNYVTVNVTSVDDLSDRISVYPNPTNGNVTIEAASMNRITVVSALGQVVYDAAVDADNVVLNLGQFKAGIYMVRISTDNGVSVKRVSVIE